MAPLFLCNAMMGADSVVHGRFFELIQLTNSAGLKQIKYALLVAGLVTLASCKGEGGGGGDTDEVFVAEDSSGNTAGGAGTDTDSGGNAGGSDTSDNTDSDNTPPPASSGKTFSTRASTARFLTQSTFGPTKSDLVRLPGSSASSWLVAQFNAQPTLHMDAINQYKALSSDEENEAALLFAEQFTSLAFWKNTITAQDQLRQRVAFALSEILVVSNASNDQISEFPETIGYYQDILVRNAFGNYRTLLQDVTYSPAMGIYLTYLGNRKGDMTTGRMPDENYAREIMQLFTIGLQELNIDGSLKRDSNGLPIETYDNSDITGLARVFTGLAASCDRFEDEVGFDCNGVEGPLVTAPMTMFEEQHSPLAKTFLGYTIPAGTTGTESIRLALDHIFAQPSLPPFVSRQLIQRLVTSHPSPDYIRRVATAFEGGTYVLPDGTMVGSGNRGDMQATIAAILFDEEARQEPALAAPTFGKVREPILRFTNWARMFEALTVTPEYTPILWDTSRSEALAQHPYRSPSVFNFFRPGYVAPGTETGAAGLTIPELQLVNSGSVAGYANFMTYFALNFALNDEDEGLRDIFTEGRLNLNPTRLRSSFIANYDDEVRLAADLPALVDHLDDLLTYSSMSEETKAAIISTLQSVPLDIGEDDGPTGETLRVQLAVLLVLSSPDFLVQT